MNGIKYIPATQEKATKWGIGEGEVNCSKPAKSLVKKLQWVWSMNHKLS